LKGAGGILLPPFPKGGRGGLLVLPYNKNLKIVARGLRKNMTDAERRIWSKIRRKQLKEFQFYRQKNIGDYIVDFYCPAAKLIVEVDGGQHYSEENIVKDEVRDRFLNDLGFRVLRFSNSDVFKNIEGVVTEIYDHL
jgi:very-short-patch-repair endonuclease